MSTVIDWQHIIETSACDFPGCIRKADFMTPMVGDDYIHYWCEQHDPEHRTKPKPVMPKVVVREKPVVRYINTGKVHHPGIYGKGPNW